MHLRLIVIAIFSIYATCVYAESNFILPPTTSCHPYEGLIDNKDGTLTDIRNGLIWMRCDIGAKFAKGQGCVGKEKKLSWTDAMIEAKRFSKDGANDWRLPTINEVNQIVDIAKNCVPVGQFSSSKPGSSAIDLRLFSKSPGSDEYKILTLDPYKEGRDNDGWPNAQVWGVNLRYGFSNLYGNEYYFGIMTRPGFPSDTGFAKLVRQPENNGGTNMALSNNLFIKYVLEPTAKKEAGRQNRNAIEDAYKEKQKIDNDERTRKTKAAME